MKLSIITITYNNVQELKRTVQSVASQVVDSKQFEHLIIDGNSSDGTMDYCIKEDLLFFSEKDNGIYDAFNKGLLRANGDYVVFLNSGDVFSDSAVIVEYLKVIRTNKLIYWFKNVHINDEGEVLRDTSVPFWAMKYLKVMPPHQATIYARSLLTLNPYDISFRIAGDFDWFVRNYNYYLEGEFHNRIVVNQEVGGVSNSGLRSITRSNKEALRSLREHSGFPYFYLVVKLLYKILLRCRNLIS